MFTQSQAKKSGTLSDLVEHLKRKGQLQARVDCPFCGGSNTFSIKLVSNGYVYHCFRASCSRRGNLKASVSAKQLKQALSPSEKPQEKQMHLAQWHSPIQENKLPEWAVKYIQRYELQEFLVYYDFLLDRLAFPVYNKKNQLVNLIGRSIKKQPKWLLYERTYKHIYTPKKADFSEKTSDVAIVLEDPVSACRLYEYGGKAILGTDISTENINELFEYEMVHLVLDKDASIKSLKIQKALKGLINIEVFLLEKDVKDMNTNEFQQFLKSIDN